jgi:hypothetical protein
MFPRLKISVQYNNMAKSFNGLYHMLQSLELKVLHRQNVLFKDIMLLAYLYRKEIGDRLEKFRWSPVTPIDIPTISRGIITLGYATEITLDGLYKAADQLGFLGEVGEVMDRGDLFYQVERTIPKNLRKAMNWN